MAALRSPVTTPALSPLSIARMLWKKKLLICFVWIAVSMVATVVVSRIPSMYKAEAVILVDSQKIPDRYVSSTVVTDAQDRLGAINQQVLSSGRLDKIIGDYDLYHKERLTRLPEEILAMMRRDIEITPGVGHAASFRIGYQGPDPVIVARVANKIASLYVEENLKTRAIQAEGTTEFIGTQLKEAKQKLDELEAALSDYKLRHNGELPQQEGSLNGILSRLGTALEANRDAINRVQQQKVMLQDSLGLAEDSKTIQLRELSASALASAASSDSPLPGIIQPKPRPRKRSEELQAHLAELRLRYNDNYPDVKQLQHLIEQAKQEEAKTRSEPIAEPQEVSARPGRETQKPPKLVLDSPELAQTRERIASIKSQLDAANQELEGRKREQQRVLSDISLYQSRVNGLPIREQEMAGLTRDYEISKANYRSLLDKKIAAEMATDMERREKSERFTIVDPARVPAKPFKPNRLVMNLGGSLLGLALGVALGLGREFQEATLLGEWELPAGLIVLGRLPYIKITPNTPVPPGGTSGHASKKSRNVKRVILSSALVSLLGMIMASLYFGVRF